MNNPELPSEIAASILSGSDAEHLKRAKQRFADGLCPNLAGFSFVWPGQGRKHICQHHANHMLRVGQALGLNAITLDMQPVRIEDATLFEEGIPFCDQHVKNED